jgi:sulfofructose kinase
MDCDRALVAVTCGEHGCYFSTDGQMVQHQPAFRVDVVDTTGCGDVFAAHTALACCAG